MEEEKQATKDREALREAREVRFERDLAESGMMEQEDDNGVDSAGILVAMAAGGSGSLPGYCGVVNFNPLSAGIGQHPTSYRPMFAVQAT